MVDKRVIIGGFAVGVAVGTAILKNSVADPAISADSPTQIVAPAVGPSAQDIRDDIAHKMTNEIVSGLRTPPTFEDMVGQVAKEQGGKISIAQMMALSKMYGQLYGTQPTYGPPPPATYTSPPSGYRDLGSMPGQAAYGAARRSVEEAYGTESASREYLSDRTVRPTVDNPIILNRAGPGQYSDQNGDIYTQAGPNGVVNTRTGEFSPVNR